jgi:integrase
VSKIAAYDVKLWLDGLLLSGKSKAAIKGMMKRLLRCAMLWKMIPNGPNPMDLFQVKNVTRRRKARILSLDEFKSLIGKLAEPFKTMALLAGLHGLGASEVLALKWKDIDWFRSEFQIERSIVNQVEDHTKTINRETQLPLDADEITMLRAWRQKAEFTDGENYIFASPHAGGELPYHYTTFLWKLEGAAKAADPASHDSHLSALVPKLGWSYGNTGGVNQGPDATLRHSDHDERLRFAGGFGPTGSAQQDRADGKHGLKIEKRTSPSRPDRLCITYVSQGGCK